VLGAAMIAAASAGWIVLDMKADWKTIYPSE
jgi:hypothetical protein